MAIKEYNLDQISEISADTFRMDFTLSDCDNGSDTCDLYFGRFLQMENAVEDDKTVEVQAKVQIPIDLALLLAQGVFALCVDYQKSTGKDIGIPQSILDKYIEEQDE